MDDGSTALHLATQGGHLSVVRLLVDSGADVERTTQRGATALDMACASGHGLLVGFLSSLEAKEPPKKICRRDMQRHSETGICFFALTRNLEEMAAQFRLILIICFPLKWQLWRLPPIFELPREAPTSSLKTHQDLAGPIGPPFLLAPK